MRYFKHHPPKQVDVGLPGADPAKQHETFIFSDWFRHVIGTDEKTNKSFATLTSARKAIEAVRATPEGEYVALEDEDWKFVESIMKEPKGFIPMVNWQLTDWMESILEASKKMPVDPGSTATTANAAE